MRPGFDIRSDRDGPWVVVLQGTCGGGTGAQLRTALDRMIDERVPAKMVFDLRAVTDFDLEFREALAQLQRQLASKTRRTAYIADRPRLRALARWICRVSGDRDADTVPNMDAARAWIGGSEDRIAAKGRHLRLRLRDLFDPLLARERPS